MTTTRVLSVPSAFSTFKQLEKFLKVRGVCEIL